MRNTIYVLIVDKSEIIEAELKMLFSFSCILIPHCQLGVAYLSLCVYQASSSVAFIESCSSSFDDVSIICLTPAFFVFLLRCISRNSSSSLYHYTRQCVYITFVIVWASADILCNRTQAIFTLYGNYLHFSEIPWKTHIFT